MKTVQQTFTNIAADVLVYSSPNKITLQDIHVGDHVNIKYRASGAAPEHSETLPFDQIDPTQQVVAAVIKNTNDQTVAANYSKYNGQEFEQVVPCGFNVSGYCSYEQYSTHK